MSYSLNEIEVLAKRAARGAGRPWGMAEEAAMAVRWLAAFGLPGPDMLAGLLEHNQGIALNQVTPGALDREWRGPAGRLDPLICGTALSDSGAPLLVGAGIRMLNVTCPLLMLPFAAAVAVRAGMPVALEWADARVVTDGEVLGVGADGHALSAPEAVRVLCTTVATVPDPFKPAIRGRMSDNCRDRLMHYAWQSFAPATDESRKRGAGAGLSDND